VLPAAADIQWMVKLGTNAPVQRGAVEARPWKPLDVVLMCG